MVVASASPWTRKLTTAAAAPGERWNVSVHVSPRHRLRFKKPRSTCHVSRRPTPRSSTAKYLPTSRSRTPSACPTDGWSHSKRATARHVTQRVLLRVSRQGSRRHSRRWPTAWWTRTPTYITSRDASSPVAEGVSSGPTATGCPNSGQASLRHSNSCSGPAKAVLAGCPQFGHNGAVTVATVRHHRAVEPPRAGDRSTIARRGGALGFARLALPERVHGPPCGVRTTARGVAAAASLAG